MTNRISVYFKEENLTDLGQYKRLTTSCRCLSEISGHWIDFLQIEVAFRKTKYTTFSYLLIPMYGQDMSEISFFSVCSGCSIFTDIWASEPELKGERRYSSSAKSRKFTNVCTVGGRFVPSPPPPPPRKLALSNLAILLIFRRSFQWCPWIFPSLSIPKVEKESGRVYCDKS